MNWKFWQRRDPWAVDQIADIDNRLAEMEGRLDSFGTAIANHRNVSQDRLDQLSEKVESLADQPSNARIAELEMQMANLEKSALTYLRRGSARLKRAEELEGDGDLDGELLRSDRGAQDNPQDESQMSLLDNRPATPVDDLASIRQRIRERRL